MAEEKHLTGVERTFPSSEIIVSKTDAKGRITYVNDIFLTVSGYTEEEVMGQPHNIIRHPEMPRCVFKLLWDTVQTGKEIFAYVNNRAKDGDYYWVLAHITPNFGPGREIIGYHSNRRAPTREAIGKAGALYTRLLQEERKYADRKEGMAAGAAVLTSILAQQGSDYAEFVLNL
ncbi:aerotaxis receptor [mine drainage metagenome]|uniref:Aerotaxis receptor n=1 Tax=mine drainage metagenome TaxID=410659 RepID=A0A1J5S6F1_9ZZZZ